MDDHSVFSGTKAGFSADPPCCEDGCVLSLSSCESVGAEWVVLVSVGAAELDVDPFDSAPASGGLFWDITTAWYTADGRSIAT